MRKITNNDSIFQTLITGNDTAIYALFDLIRLDSSALFYTDDISYITAQSNSFSPLWIFSNDALTDSSFAEIEYLCKCAIEPNPTLRIIMKESLAQSFPTYYTLHTAMNIYTCNHISPIFKSGEMLHPTSVDIPSIANLQIEMEKDIDHIDLSYEEALTIANNLLYNNDFYIWKDHGEVISMAKIATRGSTYARINHVVTTSRFRGKGYAKMLVGELCAQILNESLIPLLYADSANPYSNLAYQHIGFIKKGAIHMYDVAPLK